MSVQKYIVSKSNGNFTTFTNHVLQNLRNYEALGLYCYLSSLPHNWEFYKEQLSEHGNIGRDKINKLLKVLEFHNLITIKQVRAENGQFAHFDLQVNDGNDFKINDMTPFTEKPLTENQLLVNSSYKRNKKKQTKKKTNKEKDLCITLPKTLNPELWEIYRQYRVEIRKKLTPRAAQMALEKLREFESQGKDINAILKNSMANSWTGIYEVQQKNTTIKKPNEQRCTLNFYDKKQDDFKITDKNVAMEAMKKIKEGIKSTSKTQPDERKHA